MERRDCSGLAENLLSLIHIFVESCYFKLISKDDRFLLESEVLGTATNSVLPGQNVVPVYEVNGLEACTLGSLYIPGAEEETDDDLRSRWQEKKTGPAQNNNCLLYTSGA